MSEEQRNAAARLGQADRRGLGSPPLFCLHALRVLLQRTGRGGVMPDICFAGGDTALARALRGGGAAPPPPSGSLSAPSRVQQKCAEEAADSCERHKKAHLCLNADCAERVGTSVKVRAHAVIAPSHSREDEVTKSRRTPRGPDDVGERGRRLVTEKVCSNKSRQ
jgi:hypothetical protein